MKAKMSKKSTLTITIMACLLAVAVATTIVLAAFSASKQATTTITFSSGVQLQVTGAVLPSGTPNDDTYANTATLNWIVNVGSNTDEDGSANSNGAETVSLEAITVQAKAPGSAQVFVAVKPVVTWTGGTPASGSVTNDSSSATTFDSLVANGWTKGAWDTTEGQVGQWYLKTFTIVAANEDQSAAESFCSDVAIYTPTNTSADNNYASRVYTATIYFEAATAAIRTGS